MKLKLSLAFFALSITYVYLHLEAKRVEAEYREFLGRDRWQRAADAADRLAWLGHSLPEKDQTTIEARLLKLTRAVQSPPPSSTDGRFQYAIALAQLDRLPEAATLLEPLASHYPGARLLLATVRQAAGDFAASDEAFRIARDEAIALIAIHPQTPKAFASVAGAMGALALRAELGNRLSRADEDLVRSYDGLAYNARNDNRPAEAITVYRDALTAHPAAAADYWFQLGKTYQELEQHAEADAAYSEAEKLNPKAYRDAVAAERRRLTLSAQQCQWGVTRGGIPAVSR